MEAVERMDEALSSVERCIHSYHGARLAAWTAEQREVLRRAADLDRDALETQRGISEACFDGLVADLEGHKNAREEVMAKSLESMHLSETDFIAELRVMGEAQIARVQELVTGNSQKVVANGDAWLESQWDIFDGQLRTILWQHVRLLSGMSVAEGKAEMFQTGMLQPHLDKEREGWAESQEQDLQLLQSEVEKEHKEAFTVQAAKLKEFATNAVGGCRAEQLRILAEEEQRKLADLEGEVRAAYDAEMRAAIVQAEEDYRGYDLELQSVLLRTMRKRISDAAHMRRLKLALCRWRLDYQRVFHEHCTTMSDPTTTLIAPIPEPTEDETARQLHLVRQLVVDLWAKNKTPNSEIRRFLNGVEAAAVGAGSSQPLMKVYQEELSQYGALPILEHADRPELMDVWLEALRGGSLPPGASRRPSIASSAPGQGDSVGEF